MISSVGTVHWLGARLFAVCGQPHPLRSPLLSLTESVPFVVFLAGQRKAGEDPHPEEAA